MTMTDEQQVEVVLDVRASVGEGPVWDDRTSTLVWVEGDLHWVARVEENVATNRMNDGKCDAAGRFWAGTMAFGVTPGVASLYRLDPTIT
jgi:sugar lactone lactonase YvrE